MYHVVAHRPGGQPIGALEYAFAKLGKQVAKLLRFGRKRSLVAQGAA
jgi:lipopolysaccharide export system permease protein